MTEEMSFLEPLYSLFQMKSIQDILCNKMDTIYLIKLDERQRITQVNRAFSNMLGADENPVGLYWYEILRPLKNERSDEDMVSEFSPGKIFRLKGGLRMIKLFRINTDSDKYLLGEKFSALQDDSVEIMDHITEKIYSVLGELIKKNLFLEHSNLIIKDLVRTDSLTKLANRRHMMEYLIQQMKVASRHKSPLSIVIADIDNFKRINDNYGHLVGDKVICQLAALLKKDCRTEDLPARFGGEEFCLILPYTDANKAFDCSERIRRNFYSEIFPSVSQPISASFGIAEYKGEDDCESLINKADLALYEVKRNGKNKSLIYQEGS
jgi:two-component system, cell cycle response regulator